MLALALTESELFAALPNLGVSGILGIIVVVLYRRSERRDEERDKASADREARIRALEGQLGADGERYRLLAEAVTEQIARNTVVLEQNSQVMTRILDRLPERPHHHESSR